MYPRYVQIMYTSRVARKPNRQTLDQASAASQAAIAQAVGEPDAAFATMQRAEAQMAEVDRVYWAWSAARNTRGGRYRSEDCPDRVWRTITKMRSTGKVPRELHGNVGTHNYPRLWPYPPHRYRVIAVDADGGDILGDLQTIKAREPAEAAILALAAMDIEPPAYGLPELLEQQIPRCLQITPVNEWRFVYDTFVYGHIEVTVIDVDHGTPVPSR